MKKRKKVGLRYGKWEEEKVFDFGGGCHFTIEKVFDSGGGCQFTITILPFVIFYLYSFCFWICCDMQGCIWDMLDLHIYFDLVADIGAVFSPMRQLFFFFFLVESWLWWVTCGFKERLAYRWWDLRIAPVYLVIHVPFGCLSWSLSHLLLVFYSSISTEFDFSVNVDLFF